MLQRKGKREYIRKQKTPDHVQALHFTQNFRPEFLIFIVQSSCFWFHQIMWNLWIKKVEKLQHKYFHFYSSLGFPTSFDLSTTGEQSATTEGLHQEGWKGGDSPWCLFCWEALQHNKSDGSPAQAAASSAGFSVEPVRSWQKVQRASSSASRQHLQTPPSTSPPGALAASPPGPTRAKVRELQPLESASMRKDLKLHDPERQRLMKHFTYCELWTVMKPAEADPTLILGLGLVLSETSCLLAYSQFHVIHITFTLTW